METKNFFSQQKKILSEKLLEILSKKSIPCNLSNASKYAIGEGKFLRPLLLLSTVYTFDKKLLDKAYILACAVELIHTYSLIHDDLPCMDDDDIRRNKPSLHRTFPEWLALLTGDYFLTLAFNLLATSLEIADKDKIEIIKLFTIYSGGEKLIAGQIDDLLSENKEICWEKLYLIYKNKTASLFCLALECASILTKRSDKEKKVLKLFGEKLGVAFQIIDDIQDISITKKTSSDEKKRKATSVSILGLSQAKAKAKNFYNEAFLHIKEISSPSPLLEEFAEKLVLNQLSFFTKR